MMKDTININGVEMSAEGLVMLLSYATDPNPKMWLRFERNGTVVNVHTKMDEIIE